MAGHETPHEFRCRVCLRICCHLGEAADMLRSVSRGSGKDRMPIRVSVDRVAQLFDQALDCTPARSEEHTSELQSLMRISYAVFCLKKKINTIFNLFYVSIFYLHFHYLFSFSNS